MEQEVCVCGMLWGPWAKEFFSRFYRSCTLAGALKKVVRSPISGGLTRIVITMYFVGTY